MPLKITCPACGKIHRNLDKSLFGKKFRCACGKLVRLGDPRKRPPGLESPPAAEPTRSESLFPGGPMIPKAPRLPDSDTAPESIPAREVIPVSTPIPRASPVKPAAPPPVTPASGAVAEAARAPRVKFKPVVSGSEAAGPGPAIPNTVAGQPGDTDPPAVARTRGVTGPTENQAAPVGPAAEDLPEPDEVANSPTNAPAGPVDRKPGPSSGYAEIVSRHQAESRAPETIVDRPVPGSSIDRDPELDVAVNVARTAEPDRQQPVVAVPAVGEPTPVSDSPDLSAKELDRADVVETADPADVIVVTEADLVPLPKPQTVIAATRIVQPPPEDGPSG